MSKRKKKPADESEAEVLQALSQIAGQAYAMLCIMLPPELRLHAIATMAALDIGSQAKTDTETSVGLAFLGETAARMCPEVRLQTLMADCAGSA